MDNSTLMYLRNLASSNIAVQSSKNNQTGLVTQPDRAAMLGLQSFLNMPVDPVLLGSMTEGYLRRLYSDAKFAGSQLPFLPAPVATTGSSSASSPASSSTSSSSLQSLQSPNKESSNGSTISSRDV